MSPVDLVAALCDSTRLVEERLALAGRVRSWLDATTFALTNELARTCRPDGEVAEAARLSGRSADREVRRARTVDRVPELGAALADGDMSVDHVDVLDRALRRVEGEARDRLLEQSPGLVDAARLGRPEDFEKAVKAAVAAIESEADREARLARQKQAARLRSWVDRDTGMWRCAGEFDPETGKGLQARINRQLEALFAAGAHRDGPADPLESQQWLAAQAVTALLSGEGVAGGAPEVVVAVRADGDGTPRIDWGLPIELPRRVFEELFTDPATRVTPVIVRDGIVLYAPGTADLGRTTRLANRAQRRALRAVHATCAIDGCSVPFDRCKIHHIIWWRHGGPTDLWNLLPLCWRHHADVHDGRITLRAKPPPGWGPP